MLHLFVLLANVDITTTEPYIDYRSMGTRAGIVTISVNGNDFSDTSTENPKYLRIRMDKGTRLAETLVDLEGSATLSEPIDLAMRISGMDRAKIRAPRDTVRIIRWRRGEGELWLEIRHNSSTWIEIDGELTFPNTNSRVSWTMGRSIEKDQADVKTDYENGRSNLPANMRGNEAQHTFFMLDTSRSILAAEGLNRAQEFDCDFFVGSRLVRTALSPAGIRIGQQTNANFGSYYFGVGMEKLPVATIQTLASPLDLRIDAYNRWPDSRPVTLEAHTLEGEVSDVFIRVAKPGFNQFDILNAEGTGFAAVVVREAEYLEVGGYVSSKSGHRFQLIPPLHATQMRFPLTGSVESQLWLSVFNSNEETSHVDLIIVDQQGHETVVDRLELEPTMSDRRHMTPHLDLNVTQNLVVRSDQPVHVNLTNQAISNENQFWLQSISGKSIDR